MSGSEVTLDVWIKNASGISALGMMAQSIARIATKTEGIMLELRMLSGWSREDILTELRTGPRSLSDLLFYYRCFNRFPSEVENGGL
jgi:hypothetical protein